MKFLFLGDIVGKSGRKAVLTRLPGLQERLDIDFVVVNGENASHGFGITPEICIELFDAGVDVITGGNHSWDKVQIISYIEQENRLLRPDNYTHPAPGRSHGVFESKKGHQVLVVNLIGQTFMGPYGSPFVSLERLLPPAVPVKAGLDAVLIDFHAEVTSEKNALAHAADGCASLVVGTHTHIPTADTRILTEGTAYQTDAGMCGDYDSVIGMEKTGIVARFNGTLPRPRMVPANGEGSICGVLVETIPETGLARTVTRISVGGSLPQCLPQ